MRIASRISALFVPLLVAPLAFVGFASWFSAQDQITAVARDLLTLKLEQLVQFATAQHSLLETYDLAGDPTFRDAAVAAIAGHARQLARRESQLIAAIDRDGTVVLSTGTVSDSDAARLVASPPRPGWSRLTLSGVRRVGVLTELEPFGWLVLVTDEEAAFFAPVQRTARQTVAAAVVSVLIMLVMIAVASRLITNPLRETVHAMRAVIADGDFAGRVTATLNDETADLADSFNYMVRSLDAAYGDIKRFALNAAYSERRETKIRTVFQRYVPQHVIEQVYESPESMLVGQERALSVLISDIRGFTAFSEGLPSSQVVESLNRYFGLMVDAVDRNDGIVDKYMGDSLMAFFGAPVANPESPQNAVMTAFQMLSALDEFNAWQTGRGRMPFRIGIAVNHGLVTVGNIGSDRKMDYTVVGDMVNVVSRLEGLTKIYRQPVLITESVRRSISGRFPVRMVDRVQVMGRERGLDIWTVVPDIDADQELAWKAYHAALTRYYDRDFSAALAELRRASAIMPDDYLCKLYTERTERYSRNPPPESWKGVVKYDGK